MARDEIFADTAVCEVEDGIRQVGQLLGHVGQRREGQHVAQDDTQQLLPPEARLVERRRNTRGRNERRQALAILLNRKHAVQVT